MRIDRDEALTLFTATMTRLDELQSKRDSIPYDSEKWEMYSRAISSLLDIQTKLCDFYCEE